MRSRTFTFLSVVALLIAVVAVGCGDDDDNSGSSGGGGVTTASTQGGTAVSVEVGETSDTSYFMKVDPTSVAAGKVTFTMKNSGTKEHEMVVLKTDTAADQLQVGSDDRVSEDDSVGEISETGAGKTASVSLDLETGNYVLVCNIEKHYAKHMYSAFRVT